MSNFMRRSVRLPTGAKGAASTTKKVKSWELSIGSMACYYILTTYLQVHVLEKNFLRLRCYKSSNCLELIVFDFFGLIIATFRI